ncbi:MAG: UDP-N-acetylmuramoyl-L-alanine--D-glutamate ligase [Candidatus Aminicenantales bacterium]
MELEGSKVLVVGFGKTGEAVVRFLLRRKARVKVSEKKRREELEEKINFWQEKGVRFETGGHSLQTFLKSDLIVISPGVPPSPLLRAAYEKGIPVISEIELAYRFLRGRIVGITGTNGKSTTTTLTHKILKDNGYQAFLAGNIGNPLINFVEKSRDEHFFVTEISSFQLQYTENLKVDISVFLNISDDHLDWHSSFRDYLEAKKKLVLRQAKGTKAVLNRDHPLVWKLSQQTEAVVYPFSRKREVERGCFLRQGKIILADGGEQELMAAAEIPLFGIHNLENVMASSLVAHILNVNPSRIRKSVKEAEGLEHRLEKVATINGIDFFNDSKATNVEATLKSLESFDKKIILILGGRDKGSDFTRLRTPVTRKVKKVLLIGEAGEKIRKALDGAAEFLETSSLKEAVGLSYKEAKPGEVVLLAPACTSFDMFQNFEQRGKVFKKEVFDLKNRLDKGKFK